MSQEGFISDVDTALTKFICSITEKRTISENMILSQEQISFSSPQTGSNRGNKKLSIFLYNITEENVEGKTNAFFTLHYLITPYTGSVKDDHALLEKIIHTFLAKPLIVSADENHVGFSAKLDLLNFDELSRLWIALGTPLRLSLSLAVFSAEPLHDSQGQIPSSAVSCEISGFDAKHVTKLYQTVLKTFTEQSTGWSTRNMVAKQWVLQDFKRNSGMTVEETLSMLNDLGSKLELHQSTAQFIKSLDQLAGYYKRQLEELKGMHKVSHNQSDNLETIRRWIKEIKTLVEVLGN